MENKNTGSDSENLKEALKNFHKNENIQMFIQFKEGIKITPIGVLSPTKDLIIEILLKDSGEPLK